MGEDACPICGEVNHTCTPPVERELITVSGVVKTTSKPRVPRQNVPFGKHGYIGQVETYDPKYPNLKLVDEPAPDPEPEPEPEKPKRVERKKKRGR